ncbi:hypothetical protein [Nocardia sp. NPDC050710]|uniref:hypothetical protein n=1 Tax=Nocardia sp. NPDC050710 TaxID=3157220 RepID=UPI0033E3452C
MVTNRANFLTTLVFSLGMTGVFGIPAATADDHAAASDYGGGCVVDPGDRAATIDALRFRCSLEQQVAIFHAAPRGEVPMGTKNGWVISPGYLQSSAPAIWIGKTFYTGPDGGYVMNRITGAGIEGWQADVSAGPAIMDGAPAWVLNYAPSPTPQIHDEIREITPGVWFGFSWRRDTAPPTLLLSFALA